MRSIALSVIFAMPLVAPAIAQQDSPSYGRLNREQNEILRKTERLKELMERLLARYRRDGRTEQVRLLESGLEHLKQSRLLKAASSVQGNLENGALDDAVREQATVIEELEQLLNILLNRQSIENIDEEIEKTEQLIDQASELVERQAELREQARAARQQRASAAEQKIMEQLRALAQEQRAESAENSRQAGLQMPVLENAIARLQALLNSQKKLETATGQQLEGTRDAARDQAFELGSIESQQRDLMSQRGRQRDLQRLSDAAADLERTAKGDDRNRARDAHERLRARLEDQIANAKPGESARDRLQATLDELRAISPDATDEASRQRLEAVAKAARESAQKSAKAAGEAVDRAQSELEQRARAAAEAAKAERDGKRVPTGASRALEKAADAMKRSVENSNKQDTGEALSDTSEALRKLSDARRRHREANPTPSKRAADMAAGADQLSRDLRNSPLANNSEQSAADALESAEKALRDASETLDRDAMGETPAKPEAVNQGLAKSRSSLETALGLLQQAMQAASEGRSESMQAGAQRQEQLSQRAREANEAIEQAADQGELSPEQASAAKKAMAQAQKSMEKASKQLQNGQQSGASKSQSDAADAIDKAQQSVEQNRPMTEQEREALKQIAKEQEELEEDIINLAQLVEERQNKRAADALQQAANSAKRAKRALDEGDPEEADQQQAETQRQLEQAREELEEERDRYMDLRQEELLFRIGEELKQFLEAQQKLTEETEAAGRALAEKGRLSRPARRKLNQIGERENELTARTEFILQALVEEGVLVFSHALKANVEDLKGVSERLSGRRPDPSEYTTMLQGDVETRAEQLLAALKREQQRRQQQGNQGQQGNQFGNQQQPLVPLLAELKMLRQMEEDMQVRTNEVERLIRAAGADGVTEFDLAMAERLAHQHGSLTEIFRKIKTAIEQQMQQAEGPEDPLGGDEGKEKGK